MRWILGALGALTIAAGQAQALTWKLDAPPPVEVPPLPPGATPQTVTFSQAVIKIPVGTEWGAWGASMGCGLVVLGTFRWGPESFEIDNESFAQMFDEELARAGFHTVGDNLFEKKDVSSRFRVAFVVKDLEARICSKFNTPGGPRDPTLGYTTMAGEWQVFDTLTREVVARIDTRVAGSQPKAISGGAKLMMQSAYRQSVRALLADETFRRIVMAQDAPRTTAADASSPLKPIFLDTASAPAERPMSDAVGSVVAVFAGASLGSAFLVSADGYLITNHHVVGDAKQVKIRWSDGFETVGEVVRSHKARDVALVKTDPHGRQPLTLRRASLQPGEAVFAIGSPLSAELQSTVTKGVVSANRIQDGFSFIQSDVAVTHGNSGGPLLDEKGAVVGIAVSGLEPAGAPIGLNFFIPIGDALDFLALKPQS